MPTAFQKGSMPLDPIRQRDALMRAIRAFFHCRGYVEVETPIRIGIPCMELHIDAEPSGTHFLRTSPEVCHKQLLAAGHERIFEVGKCFRRGEFGPLHHPEYTMLEWYRTGVGYMEMLEETRALLEAVWASFPCEWNMFTVSEAFSRHAGWDPCRTWDADRFDMDLVDKVEPAFKQRGGAVVLVDYPVEAAALSRRKPENPMVAERWELYVNGIELANAYSELTDPVEQRQRFAACAAEREAMGKPVYGIDEQFLSALGRIPCAGGVALGVDRLLMLSGGFDSLDPILPFR